MASAHIRSASDAPLTSIWPSNAPQTRKAPPPPPSFSRFELEITPHPDEERSNNNHADTADADDADGGSADAGEGSSQLAVSFSSAPPLASPLSPNYPDDATYGYDKMPPALRPAIEAVNSGKVLKAANRAAAVAATTAAVVAEQTSSAVAAGAAAAVAGGMSTAQGLLDGTRTIARMAASGRAAGAQLAADTAVAMLSSVTPLASPFSLGTGKPLRPTKQYVDKVVNYSSQYGAISYSADMLAGRSRIFPSYGDFTQAFAVRTFGPWWQLAPEAPPPVSTFSSRFGLTDFIELKFEQPVFPESVVVYETYNPGAVARILAAPYSSTARSSPNGGSGGGGGGSADAGQ